MTTPMEAAAREILASAPAVPPSVLARWSDSDAVAWDGLAEWLEADGTLSGGARRIVAGAIALARADFAALDAGDADVVADALTAAAEAYRAAAGDQREALARLLGG